MRHSVKTTRILPLFLPLTFALTIFASAEAASPRLLFTDDFERDETQQLKDELGNDWNTNSDKRAGGNKQVDLVDGTLHVFKHKTAHHNVSMTHPAKYKDCRVQLRFRIDHERDDLGIDFADMNCREVHAGHICKVFVRADGIEIFDFKFGRMNKPYRDAVKAGDVSDQQKTQLKNWQKQIGHTIALHTWHDLVVTIIKDTMAVELDGNQILSFTSPGMGHPQKDMIRFSARREVWLDDVKMHALSPEQPSSKTASQKASSQKTSVKHLFVAKLLLRRLDHVDLTNEQLDEFNQMSAGLREFIDQERAAVGITAETINRRDEAYSKLKQSDLSGDALWNELQQQAGLTSAQRDVFRETMDHYKKFRTNALKILTDEQRKRLPKGKLSKSK